MIDDRWAFSGAASDLDGVIVVTVKRFDAGWTTARGTFAVSGAEWESLRLLLGRAGVIEGDHGIVVIRGGDGWTLYRHNDAATHPRPGQWVRVFDADTEWQGIEEYAWWAWKRSEARWWQPVGPGPLLDEV